MKDLILVIEDDSTVRKVIRNILEAEGYAVALAESGKEGLELLKRFSPTVVVTDLIMPGRGGIETIMEMRRSGRSFGIIAISGGGKIGNTDLLSIARQYGADAALAKPFEPGALLKLVARLGKRAQGGEAPAAPEK